MPSFKYLIPILLSSLFLSIYSPACTAQTEKKYKSSLSKISSEIKSISRNLNANKSKLEVEQTELLVIEEKISNINKDLELTIKKVSKARSELSNIDIQQKTLSIEQNKSRRALAGLIESNYKNGASNQLKMVLNQENPYAVGRLNNYQAYLAKAIDKRFQELEKQLLVAKSLFTKQKRQILELQSLEQEQQFLMQTHKQQGDKRRTVVNKLNAKVVSSENRLAKLKSDRSRLNSLLRELAKRKAELQRIEREKREAERLAAEKAEADSNVEPVKPVTRTPVKGGFIKQKGRLLCPVARAPRTRYGERLVSSGMKSEGVFYETKQSVPVKSIFRGQVLFADFLKGFGLLMIVDHGDDHISLYGHNEVLYKKVGDTVITNEVISKTGMTGGLKIPGLYFEIRNNTSPVNPSIWCK